MAAEKVTLARVSHFKKDKDGNPLTTRAGKPYTRCLIDTTDGRKLSGFGNQTTSSWNEGMEVDIEVTESNGYLNFSVPKMDNRLAEMAIKTHIDQKFAVLMADLKVIADHLGVEKPTEPDNIPGTGVPYPEEPKYDASNDF